LQRFFSTFPAHWPGAGLVLLRVAAGGVAALQGAVYLTRMEGPTAASWGVGLVLVLGAIGLITGFMTPGAAAAVTLSTAFIAATSFQPAGSAVLDFDGPAAALVIVDAVALAVLGPGAYSVDAYLFGRREIIIPNLPPR
jgi:uncharacterized membrane protein YphA (DoxX/SURF4 family)